MHAGKRGVIELNVIFAVLFAKYSLASPLEATYLKKRNLTSEGRVTPRVTARLY